MHCHDMKLYGCSVMRAPRDVNTHPLQDESKGRIHTLFRHQHRRADYVLTTRQQAHHFAGKVQLLARSRGGLQQQLHGPQVRRSVREQICQPCAVAGAAKRRHADRGRAIVASVVPSARPCAFPGTARVRCCSGIPAHQAHQQWVTGCD